MIYVTFFLTITLLFYWVFNLNRKTRERVSSRVQQLYAMDDRERPAVEKDPPQTKHFSFIKSFVTKKLNQIKRSTRQSMATDKAEKLERRLLQAGSPFGLSTVEFRLIQWASLILIPFVGLVYGIIGQFSMFITLIFVVMGFSLGASLPHFYLKQKAKTRSMMATKELPDILDLLTVSLEAGLGFDGALSRVVSRKNGVLSREFHRCIEEIRLGKTRREALLGIKERLLAEDIRVLIANIVQAEKLGIGMVKVLQIQSQEVREKRKQRAEEAAMKAPIKMMFPLVLFIFPSLFIVVLGPAVLQFIAAFR